MMKVIIASNNHHKIQEIQDILKDLPLEVMGYKDILKETIDVIEDGLTFEENAMKKALAFPAHPKHIYLADDSGLEVEALNGAPGIYSARYAGNNDTSKEALCKKLLSDLKDKKNRKAQFRCVIAIRFPQNLQIAQGIVKGKITKEMKGEKGFGYDPVFVPKGHTQTFAQMQATKKNQLSHRFLALQQARKLIEINLKVD